MKKKMKRIKKILININIKNKEDKLESEKKIND